MRVAHFVRAFSPLSESFIYDHVIEMRRQGVDCHVLTLNRENSTERPFEPVIELRVPSKASFRRIFYKTLGFAAKREKSTYLWPIYRAALRKTLKEVAPDVIHAHFGPEGAVIAPIARQLQIPLVVTFYGYDASRLAMSARWRHRYQALFAQADGLVGVSSPVCNQLRALGADSARVRLIHLGVHLDKFPYSDPLGRFDGRTVRCIHVGRLTPKKSPLHLLEAFRAAVHEVGNRVDLKLTIIGDGELFDSVSARIAELGLADRVELLGGLPHVQILTQLKRAHIYTQHSLTAENGDQEGLPVSILEASASGLPVISTKHSGIPEIVLDGESGFLVEERDVETMGKRIVTLCLHPELWPRFGAAGRHHVQNYFNLPNLVGESIRLVEHVIAQRRSA